MMMPANFSAVAENEMTYVVGGSLVDILVPAMTTENWANINANLITIIGNTYLNNGLGAALATVFGGNYKPGKVLNAYGEGMKDLWLFHDDGTGTNNWAFAKALVNTGLQVVGGLAAVYTLGSSKVGLSLTDGNLKDFFA